MSTVAHDWVAHHAATRPDAVALSSHDGGPTLTWAELDGRVANLAHTLRHHFGVGRGDRVTVVAENDPRMFELQFATWRLGGIRAAELAARPGRAE